MSKWSKNTLKTIKYKTPVMHIDFFLDKAKVTRKGEKEGKDYVCLE
jgi:hypothetical protein